MEWDFEITEDWDIIKGNTFIEKWNNLLEKSFSSHVFFHPSMAFAWIDTYLPIRKIMPIFIWGKTKSGNEAFFPLVLWYKNWKNIFLKTIIPVGYSDYDYHDPIFKFKPNDLDIFWNDLFFVLRNRYKYDTIDISGIRPIVIGTYFKWKKSDICPFLDISKFSTSEDLMNFFKTKLRGDIRRQIRRLEEKGKLELIEYNDIGEVDKTFDDFMYYHSLKWPNAYKAPGFHRNMISNGIKNGIVHFSSLNIDNKPIAWHLGFVYNNVYYYYMPAGNSEYSNFSPVKIHLYYLMVNAIKKGYKIYDHLRGDENYKTGWSDNYIDLYNCSYQNSEILSKIKFHILNIKKNILHRK